MLTTLLNSEGMSSAVEQARSLLDGCSIKIIVSNDKQYHLFSAFEHYVKANCPHNFDVAVMRRKVPRSKE